MRNIVVSVVGSVVIIAVIVIASIQYSECAQSGGEFVRGLVWFKCIGE
jgi:hypothetical protein